MISPVEVLDRLAAVCVDSEKRYLHAASDVSREDLEKFFKRQAELRKTAADELQTEIKRHGSTKEPSGTLAGSLDTIGMDLSVVMSKGDSGVADWCRQDADAVAGEYEKALAGDLPPELRPILERQLTAVRNTLFDLDWMLRAYGGPRS